MKEKTSTTKLAIKISISRTERKFKQENINETEFFWADDCNINHADIKEKVLHVAASPPRHTHLMLPVIAGFDCYCLWN